MTPLDDDVGIAKLERRLGVLVRHFRELAPGMSDLPLYNQKVSVEAVDFLPFGGMGLGVLVTPWFINLKFLPLDPVPFETENVGRVMTVELPAGQRAFALGGDEVTGLYWSHCIMSPLTDTLDHAAAVAVARSRLARVLTKPSNEPAPSNKRANKSRRQIIFNATTADSVPV